MKLKENQKDFIIALSSVVNDKVILVIAISENLVNDYHAGNIVSEMAKICGGGGGGKADIASAGAKDASKIDDSFQYLVNLIKS